LNRWLGLSFACCFGAILSAIAPSALAEPAQRPERDGYSSLERSVIQQSLAERGLSLEVAPEGKLIEDVQVVSLDVFDERDPVPDFVNVFHATTREPVVRRELLFHEGEPYRATFAHETARNLRNIQQLSIVLVVPVKGSRPDRVRVLVITKDVWSLRLNWALQISNSSITSLVLNPSEENLFGSHAVVGALFIMDPAAYSLGASIAHRRLFGSHQQIALSGSVINNRYSGAAEGSFGEFRYGQPLYSLATEWSWGTSILWRNDIARRFNGAQVDTTRAGIPVEYTRDRLYGGYELVRSFGRRFKYDLSLGVEADRGVYHSFDLSNYSEAAVDAFIATVLPVSDQRVGPFVQLHAHRTDFRSLLDVEALSLQEDYRRGHDLLLRMYAGSSALGSTRDLIGSQASLSYTLPVADGFVRPVLSSTIEYASRSRDDALIQVALRFVSPRLGFGRLIVDGLFADRYRNYSNRYYALSTDNRLRGYVKPITGSSLISVNTELRSTSIDILSAQVGAAAFYDVGNAWFPDQPFKLKQSVGVGLRVLFPQFDRIVLRADWGFPLTPGYSTFPGAFFLSFGQAFTMPGVPVPSVLTEKL
jgi:hypothetical protein